jgi:hypothetical protein
MMNQLAVHFTIKLMKLNRRIVFKEIIFFQKFNEQVSLPRTGKLTKGGRNHS